MTKPLRLPTEDATGVTYTPDILDPQDWSRDLSAMRMAGMRLVRSGEFIWSWLEPEPGKRDFSQLLRYMDLVRKSGLKLVLSTPTATVPMWMERLIPDMRMQDAGGQPFMGFRHFACRNHPQVLERMESLLQELAAAVCGHPALVGWQVDNEPHYGDTVQAGSIEKWCDFHPHAWQAFVAWMMDCVSTPTDLDDCWKASFWSQRARVWDDVSIHHVLNNPHARLDWLRWRAKNLAQHLRWQAGILRASTPGIPVGINVPVVPPSDLLRCGIDYAEQVRDMDWVGADLYQASGDRDVDMAMLRHKLDLVRSFAGDAQFLVAEAQGGAHSRVYNGWFAEEPFGTDYLEACWEQFALHGAEAVWWFQWRPAQGGFEHGMNGIQDLKGQNSRFTRTVRQLADKPMKESYSILKERPLVRVAHFMDSFAFLSFWAHQLPQIDCDFLGWHELLEAAGFRVEYFGDKDLEQSKFAGRVPLVLPVAPVLSGQQRIVLRDYPGTVFSGPSSGFHDETGQIITSSNCPLQDVLPVNWETWQDSGRWFGPGYFPRPSFRRRMCLKAGSEAIQVDENGDPWIARSGRRLACGLPLGEVFTLSGSQQREKLAMTLHSVLTIS